MIIAIGEIATECQT